MDEQRRHKRNRILWTCVILHGPALLTVDAIIRDATNQGARVKLGAAGRKGRATDADVKSLLQRFPGAAAARNALEEVNAYWRHTLGAVQVATPDAAEALARRAPSRCTARPRPFASFKASHR